MEIYKPEKLKEELSSHGEMMREFYSEHSKKEQAGVKRITLEHLNQLKENGISTEDFLDHICREHSLLLHGSINEIPDGKLKPNKGRIYATDKPAIAILKSLYSNKGAKLQYPYFIDEHSPLKLKIENLSQSGIIGGERGFVYVVNGDGFVNEPEGSWQYYKETGQMPFEIIIETEKGDFKYPVEYAGEYEMKD